MYKTVDEHNQAINERGYVGYEGTLDISFRDRKRVFMVVSYGTHGQRAQDPYFSTSASELNYTRSDYDSCGQGQESLLEREELVEFFNKWDKYHLKTLTFDEYEELVSDLEYLQERVDYIESSGLYDQGDFDRELS